MGNSVLTVTCPEVDHSLLSSYAVCRILVRSRSCKYPICICLCPFNLSCEWSTTGHVMVKTEFPRLVPHVIVLSVSYMVYTRFVRYTTASRMTISIS